MRNIHLQNTMSIIKQKDTLFNVKSIYPYTMKSVIRNASRTLFLAGGITLAATAVQAQMKIGDNPTDIKKSAILELNSTRQGLLLPRLTDFTGINTAIGTDPVDGMIVYLNSGTAANDGVYMRKGGAWVKIASAADALANWGTTGNAGTTAANYIGTSDNQPLSIRTNGVERINVATDGQLQFKNVISGGTSFDVLVIDQTTGAVTKRQLPKTAFNTLVSNFSANAATTNADFNISENATTGALTINAPVLGTGSAATGYGFLSVADWNKLQNLSAGNNITVADFITTVAAGEENRGGKISYNAGTAVYTLELFAASATNAGIVTTGAQTFGGNKTFANDLTVTGATTASNGLTVSAGNVTVNSGNLALTTGNATIGGTLNAGASTLSSLTVSGASSLNTLATTGAATVGGALTLNTVATLPATTTGALNVLVQDGSNTVVKRAFDMAAIESAVQFITTGGGTGSTGGASVAFNPGTTGTDFNIVADGTAKTVTFNVPDASAVDATHTAAQRGAVSTGDQTFAGKKSFASTVAVGANTTANSTLQVAGSVSMAIKSVNADYTVTADDNTILAKPTTSQITITLPAPSTAAASNNVGRIYTIKKVSGDIDNPVVIMPGGGTIEGGTSYTIYNDWTYITVQTDGTAWYIIKK